MTLESPPATTTTSPTGAPPANGSTAPATSAPSGGAPPSTTAPAASVTPDWMAGLGEEDKAFLQLKKYDGVGATVKALRHAQEFIGAPTDEIVRIPKAGLDPEGRKALLARINMAPPATPDAYELPVPAQNGDPELAKAAGGWFHKHGLTKDQAVGITQELNTYVAGLHAQAKTQHEMSLSTEATTLRAEWGEAYDRRINVAKNAAGAFGLTPEDLTNLQTALGPAKMAKFVYNLASKVGEDRFLGGDAPSEGGNMTPAMADQKIEELRSDKDFMKRFINGGKKEAAEWEAAFKARRPVDAR